MKLSTFVQNVINTNNTNKIIEISSQNLNESLFHLTLSNDTITNVLIKPKQNSIFKYEIGGDETIQFQTPNSNEVISFRLYLIMPSTLSSITLPSNIEWDEAPELSETNSLYMLVFEFNPIINKWLGNLMWDPISLGE